MSTKIKISSSASWQVIYYSGYGKWDRLTEKAIATSG
jgi:hypothetical protein